MYRVLTSVEALPELEQLLHRRTALGLDHRDEMWEGVLHMVPLAGGPHQDLASGLIEVLRPRAKACGLNLTMETGLFDPDAPDDRWRVPDLVAAHPEHWTARGVEGPAELVVEILSPRDETFAKFSFYAEMGVAQILVIEPVELAFSVHRLDGVTYRADDDGLLDALDVHLERADDEGGPVLVLTMPDRRSEIRPWGTVGSRPDGP
jgi:Uma2 family endonuclease